jgi:hypothetical protein
VEVLECSRVAVSSMVIPILCQQDWDTLDVRGLEAVPDCVITDPLYDALPPVQELLDCCSGNVIMFCDPMHRPDLQADEILYWIKQPSTKNTAKRCSRFVEEIHVFRRGNLFNRLHWSCMTGIFYDTVIDYPSLHPWQKPESMMEKLIRIYSNPGDVVFDPYMGSGTTGVAAVKSGRGFIGCELDPETFSLAKQRIDGWYFS